MRRWDAPPVRRELPSAVVAGICSSTTPEDSGRSWSRARAKRHSHSGAVRGQVLIPFLTGPSGMVCRHTCELVPRWNTAVTLDQRTLGEVDRLVRQRAYPNRSRVIEEALRDRLLCLKRSRLVQELAKLDPEAERSLAEEGLAEDG